MTSALITGVGSGVAQSIIKALRYASESLGREYRILGTDTHAMAIGLYRVDKGFIVPECSNPEYIQHMSMLCVREGVDVLIPGSDPEVLALAQARDEVEARTGAKVLVSPYHTVRIGHDKWETYEFLRDNGFGYPETACVENAWALAERVQFPLIVKPRTGSGSVGVHRVADSRELERILPGLDDRHILQECLLPDDAEYTCGVVIGSGGDVIDSIAMWRELKKGSTYRAQVADEPVLLSEMERIACRLEVRGAINLQCRVTDSGPVVFEINPRFSGTTAARAVAGLNEPDISIRDLLFCERPSRARKRPITMLRCLMEMYVLSDVVEEARQRGVAERKGEFYSYF